MGFVSDTWDDATDAVSDGWDSITDEVERGWDSATDEVSRAWDDYGKDIAEGVAIVYTGGLYYVGKKGYESYEAAKKAQEEAEKAQKEYNEQQRKIGEAQERALEEEAKRLQANVAKLRRQAFADKSVTSNMAIGVEENPIYSTKNIRAGNTIPNLGGINI